MFEDCYSSRHSFLETFERTERREERPFPVPKVNADRKGGAHGTRPKKSTCRPPAPASTTTAKDAHGMSGGQGSPGGEPVPLEGQVGGAPWEEEEGPLQP